jgi:TRAP-type C4-dicarboxylate transport system permease small subunit
VTPNIKDCFYISARFQRLPEATRSTGEYSMKGKEMHWNILLKMSDWSDTICRFAIALMMAAMVLDVLIGVANRFILRLSISWTEQLARFLLIWISMLGAAVAVRWGSHIGVMFVVTRLKRWRPFIMVTNAILIIGFLVVVGVYGIKLCISQSQQVSPVLQLSMSWPYLSIPTGCLFMIIHYLSALKSPSRIFDGQSIIEH